MIYMYFTNKSRSLISFVETIPIPHHFSNPSTPLMKSIYRDLLDSYQYVSSLPSDTFRKKSVSTREILLPTTMTSHSFPQEIIAHIHKHITREVSCSFQCVGRKITIYWMFEKEVSLQTCREYTFYVKMWLYLLNMYASKQCVDSLVLYFYMTSHEKKLPERASATLDVIHVNTAFTMTCPVRGEIVVFRREEWFKVFIHETFHTFALDFSNMNNEGLHRCISRLFHISSKMNAFEAYSEFWAETMNVAFASFFSQSQPRGGTIAIANINTFIKEFELGMNLERTFSYFQLAKVLKHMGLTYDELLESTSAHAHAKYKENTNVFAYYVLKTIWLNQYPAFMQWCKHNNTHSLMDFRKTRENQSLLCDFIEKQYKHPRLLQMCRIPWNWRGKKGFLMQTMRMSVVEWI